MKLVLRTVILLAVAALVAGLAVFIVGQIPVLGAGRFDGGRRPGFAEGQPPSFGQGQPQQGQIVRIRPDGGGRDGGDFGNATSNLFGLREAVVNLALIAWVTLLGVLGLRLLRWLRGAVAKKPRAPASPG